MISATPPHPLWTPFRFLAFLITPYTPAEKAGMKRAIEWRKDGLGYLEIQSTRPQTIGYSLADSPVGLLSWIYEKLVTWTDEYPFTDDEGLCGLVLYNGAFTNSLLIHTSFDLGLGLLVFPCGTCSFMQNLLRIQEKHHLRRYHGSHNTKGCQLFPKRTGEFAKSVSHVFIRRLYHSLFVYHVRRWVRASGNVVFESEHASGGHFAAYEKPAELVGDLRSMFGKGGPAFGVVPGKTGYLQV